MLEGIQKHFRAPPISVLEAWEPANLLDSLSFNRSDIYSSTNTGLIEQLLHQSVELHNAVGLEAMLQNAVNGVPCLLNGRALHMQWPVVIAICNSHWVCGSNANSNAYAGGK